MISFDDAMLDDVGLGEMPADERKAFLQFASERLQVVVGTTIASRMTDAQLQEFNELEHSGVEGAALAALDRAIPDRQQIVEQHYAELKAEIAACAPQILAEMARPTT